MAKIVTFGGKNLHLIHHIVFFFTSSSRHLWQKLVYILCMKSNNHENNSTKTTVIHRKWFTTDQKSWNIINWILKTWRCLMICIWSSKTLTYIENDNFLVACKEIGQWKRKFLSFDDLKTFIWFKFGNSTEIQFARSEINLN